ncbi:MAG TPA: hypothetical protein VGO26_10535 [Amnibacterium sp.]|nr:hypothetical protein [Amnibacterium sp.]
MLRIDPAAALVWRSPSTLQIGVDPPLAVLADLPPTAERLVTALVAGTDPATLAALAVDRDLEPDELQRILTAVEPALMPAPPPAPSPVLVEGPQELVAGLGVTGGLLARAPEAALPVERPALVVLAGHHVLAPGRAARWLAIDVPHLPVVFGERAAMLGPFVLPGATPCLRCADEHRIDADPAWPVLGGQLLALGAAAAADAPALRMELHARLASALRSIRAGGAAGLAGSALRIASDGSVSRLARPWHARCSCRSPAPAA